MKNTIAVMNTKGGVGKSTLVMALAETFSAYEDKSVLVIDSDSQASVSSMLMNTADLYQIQSGGKTIVEYLVSSVLNNHHEEWRNYVVPQISDVDDAETVLVLPSDVQLTLFEREVSREAQHARLRTVIGNLIRQMHASFDLILVDCPPGLSVLTESWLREAHFHITPTKADYISTCGLEVFRRFKQLHPEMGFAENLGVVINMKDVTSPADEEYHRWLLQDRENMCFDNIIPRMTAMQDASRFRDDTRSYAAKYPGVAGKALRGLAKEILLRLPHDENNEISEAQRPAVVPSAG
ncbi:MAG: ParA family protein [Hyphomicrobiaceae bacterium]